MGPLSHYSTKRWIKWGGGICLSWKSKGNLESLGTLFSLSLSLSLFNVKNFRPLPLGERFVTVKRKAHLCPIGNDSSDCFSSSSISFPSSSVSHALSVFNEIDMYAMSPRKTVLRARDICPGIHESANPKIIKILQLRAGMRTSCGVVAKVLDFKKTEVIV